MYGGVSALPGGGAWSSSHFVSATPKLTIVFARAAPRTRALRGSRRGERMGSAAALTDLSPLRQARRPLVVPVVHQQIDVKKTISRSLCAALARQTALLNYF
jgi:hypothetical protein